jgi:hypothetical protein
VGFVWLAIDHYLIKLHEFEEKKVQNILKPFWIGLPLIRNIVIIERNRDLFDIIFICLVICDHSHN